MPTAPNVFAVGRLSMVAGRLSMGDGFLMQAIDEEKTMDRETHRNRQERLTMDIHTHAHTRRRKHDERLCLRGRNRRVYMRETIAQFNGETTGTGDTENDDTN